MLAPVPQFKSIIFGGPDLTGLKHAVGNALLRKNDVAIAYKLYTILIQINSTQTLEKGPLLKLLSAKLSLILSKVWGNDALSVIVENKPITPSVTDLIDATVSELYWWLHPTLNTADIENANVPHNVTASK